MCASKVLLEQIAYIKSLNKSQSNISESDIGFSYTDEIEKRQIMYRQITNIYTENTGLIQSTLGSDFVRKFQPAKTIADNHDQRQRVEIARRKIQNTLSSGPAKKQKVIKELQKELNTMNKEFEEIKQTVEDFQRQDYKQKRQEALSHVKSKANSLETNLANLKTLLNETLDPEKCREQISSIIAELRSIQEQKYQTITAQISNNGKQLNSLLDDYRILNQVLQDKKQEEQKLKYEIDEFNKQHNDLEKEIGTTNQKISKLIWTYLPEEEKEGKSEEDFNIDKIQERIQKFREEETKIKQQLEELQ